MHVEFPVISFICCLLVLAPLPWHWRAGTVPTIAITIWLFLGNLINGVNAIVWGDDAIVRIPVWCDITTKIAIGSDFALPAAILCLCIQLEQVSSTRQVQTSLADKRRRQVWNSILCFFLPIVYMALHYVVQGHRFDIVEGFGCRPQIYNSIASIFILWVPALVISLAAGIYSALALHHFWIRRITFERHLQSKNSALTSGHYFRLMAMALLQIFWSVVITALNMWFTMKKGLRPWISWEDVHVNFGRIGQSPRILIPDNIYLYTYALWWTVPLSSIMFFAFFSFGREAMKEYAGCIRWFRRVVLRCPERPTKAIRAGMLPSFVGRDANVIKLPRISRGSFPDLGPNEPTTPSATAVDSEFSCPSQSGKDTHDEESVCPSYYGTDSALTHTSSFRDEFRLLVSERSPISPSRPMSFPSFFSRSSSR
ncbi:pheromone A receptor-domain-containing protein [Mucidula mucida]|nr:pheromone A receptor-domain-containing protein [Mucidula mucida]